jgi:hypothetical protein
MLVSDAVHELTHHEVTFGQRHELDLRGKVGRVVAHEVIAVGTPPDRTADT